jgi:hypothetical protein
MNMVNIRLYSYPSNNSKEPINMTADADNSLFALFGASETDSEDGKWFPINKVISVKVRRFKSKKSRTVRERLEAPHKRINKFGGKISDDVQNEITKEHMAEAILVDWKGVTDTDGKLVEYTKATGMKFFTTLPEFMDAIATLSIDLDNYRDEVKEAVKGN